MQADLWVANNRITKLKKELEIVDWYIRFTIDDRDPKQILEGYYDAVKERELLESEHDELKDKFGLLEDETSKKVDEVMKKLKDQHNKVINPLVKELKVSTELQNRLKADLDRNLKEMKEMSAILRIPTLTAEFQRMLRAKDTEKKIEADK